MKHASGNLFQLIMPSKLFYILFFALASCSLIEQKQASTNIEEQLETNITSDNAHKNVKNNDSNKPGNSSTETKLSSIKPQQKSIDKVPRKTLTREQKLERIDRQSGNPDTSETTDPELNSALTNGFVFSPLFEDVQSLPVTPLLSDQSDSKPLAIEQLLPKQTTAKDYSQYGFFTPTKAEVERSNEQLTQKSTRVEQQDLIEVMRKDFQLDLTIDNKRIQSQLNWYVRNPSYLDRTFRRSSRYIYHVVEKIRQHDLPMELALLPFVESAYDPFAYSHGRASGLWQFIPGTGKIYKLHQNWWYDGRRDILASTQAAMEYLGYLGKRFKGDWLHALAAYNSGSGRVSGAIRKNKKKNKDTDFWSLKLPKETRAYVPKLLALAKIVQDPAKYGVMLPKVPNKPYFKVVDTGGQIDLAQAASLASVDINEIYKLNPGFNQWATAPLGPHRLLIPVDKAETLKTHLRDLPADKRLSWTRYSVKAGDSLIKISKKFNTTPKLIKEVNNLRSNMIRQKQKLLIPVASRGKSYYDLSQSNRLATKQNRFKAPKGTSKLEYIVKSGDTLWDLSREHKVGLRSLAKWNGMAPTDPIKPGQKLLIWSKKQLSSSKGYKNKPNFRSKRNMIKKIGYKVRRGDSLARIAAKFNVAINDLVTWNKLNKKKYLQPGQKLTIFVDITNS